MAAPGRKDVGDGREAGRGLLQGMRLGQIHERGAGLIIAETGASRDGPFDLAPNFGGVRHQRRKILLSLLAAFELGLLARGFLLGQAQLLARFRQEAEFGDRTPKELASPCLETVASGCVTDSERARGPWPLPGQQLP
jgi:hypothetical protein